METGTDYIVQGTALKKAALTWPTDVMALLRNGSVTVYDLLALLVNGVNSLCGNYDGNMDTLNDWTANVANWADEFKGDVQDLIANGVAGGMVIKDGSITKDNLTNDVLKGLLKGGQLDYITDDEGNPDYVLTLYFEGKQTNGTSAYQIAIDMKSLIEYCKANGNGTTIENAYCNSVGRITIVSSDNSKKDIDIPFATDVELPSETSPKYKYGGLMTIQQSNKLDNFWIDSNNQLHYNGSTYQLTKISSPVTVTSIVYSAPVIGGLSYNISASGCDGLTPAALSISQKVTTYYSDGTNDGGKTTTATLANAKSLGFVVTYAKESGNDGTLTVQNTSTGAIKVPSSTITSLHNVGRITVTVYNSNDSSSHKGTSTFDIYQQAYVAPSVTANYYIGQFDGSKSQLLNADESFFASNIKITGTVPVSDQTYNQTAKCIFFAVPNDYTLTASWIGLQTFVMGTDDEWDMSGDLKTINGVTCKVYAKRIMAADSSNAVVWNYSITKN